MNRSVLRSGTHDNWFGTVISKKPAGFRGDRLLTWLILLVRIERFETATWSGLVTGIHTSASLTWPNQLPSTRRMAAMSGSLLHVFISSTSEDLQLYRDAARGVVLDQKWLPVMMENFKTDSAPTVEACRRRVAECDLLLLIVAFRQGWVPTPKQGGNGRKSITAYEVEEARRRGIPVRALLANVSWPGNLWDPEPKAREGVLDFRAKLNLPADFFDHEPATGVQQSLPVFRSKVRQALLDHRDVLWEHASQIGARPAGRRSVGAEVVLPELEEHLTRLILPRQEVLWAYECSAPRGWEPVSVETNPLLLLVYCARSLARAPRQRGGGVFPLLRFVQQLALVDHLPAGEADRLEGWLAQAAALLAADAADERRLRAGPAPEARRDARALNRLLVQCSPRLDPAMYGVKAWLFDGRGSRCLLAGEGAHARKDLPALLTGLRVETARNCPSLAEVWVEFLLPRALLCEDVDQWKVTVHLDGVSVGLPIGAEHRVSVRSLDRARRHKAASALRARWDILLHQTNEGWRLIRELGELGAGQSLLIWVGGDKAGTRELCHRLADADSVVVALLDSPPQPAPTDARNDLLNAILESGVPVVLWARRALPDGDDLVELESLLKSGGLFRLLDHVWDLRKRALLQEDQAHTGRHLTLLWDDPTAPSPDFDDRLRLRAPRQKRRAKP